MRGEPDTAQISPGMLERERPRSWPGLLLDTKGLDAPYCAFHSTNPILCSSSSLHCYLESFRGMSGSSPWPCKLALRRVSSREGPLSGKKRVLASNTAGAPLSLRPPNSPAVRVPLCVHRRTSKACKAATTGSLMDEALSGQRWRKNLQSLQAKSRAHPMDLARHACPWKSTSKRPSSSRLNTEVQSSNLMPENVWLQ